MERSRISRTAYFGRTSCLFVLTLALLAAAAPAWAQVDLPGTGWILDGTTTLTLRARGQMSSQTLPELVGLVFEAGATNEGGACSLTISGTENDVVLPCTFTAKTPRRAGAATKILIDLDDEPLRAELESLVRNANGDPGAAVTLESRRVRGTIDPVTGLLEIGIAWKGKIVFTVERLTVRVQLTSDLSGMVDETRAGARARGARTKTTAIVPDLTNRFSRPDGSAQP